MQIVRREGHRPARGRIQVVTGAMPNDPALRNGYTLVVPDAGGSRAERRAAARQRSRGIQWVDVPQADCSDG